MSVTLSVSLEYSYPKLDAQQEPGDAELAAALQKMENDAQNEHVILQQQAMAVPVGNQVQVPQHQNAVIIDDDAPVTGTAKQWYLESIKNTQHNNCSCKCKDTSAWSAARFWFVLDLVHNLIHIFLWIFAGIEVHQGGAITFAILWILIGFTNLFAILGTNDFYKIFIEMKLAAFPLSCILFWVEIAFIESFLLYMVIPVIIIQFVLMFFALRDTWKIYKWMIYYKKGG
eukprot:UN03282